MTKERKGWTSFLRRLFLHSDKPLTTEPKNTEIVTGNEEWTGVESSGPSCGTVGSFGEVKTSIASPDYPIPTSSSPMPCSSAPISSEELEPIIVIELGDQLTEEQRKKIPVGRLSSWKINDFVLCHLYDYSSGRDFKEFGTITSVESSGGGHLAEQDDVKVYVVQLVEGQWASVSEDSIISLASRA